MNEPQLAIVAQDVFKRYGSTAALDGLDLSVTAGTILGVLGPNGAGKTTAVRVLTTLVRPDAGVVRVCGFDVLREPDQVRRRIGLAGQSATVDELLSGRENLLMVGQLFHLSRREAVRRAEALLERLDLTDAARRPVRTYSGGMRRRIDLAASLIAQPPVLFLDEPTTGLDPRNRLELWEIIREQAASGATVLLTTQYLDEADRLADDIAVIDHGRVIAGGSPEELKRQIGGERLEIRISDSSDLARVARVIALHGSGIPAIDASAHTVSVPVTSRPGLLASVVRDLDALGVQINDLNLRQPTLDDVFFALTGSRGDDQEHEQEGRQAA